jgi:hypothetical protein
MADPIRTPLSPERLKWNRRAAMFIGSSMVLLGVPGFLLVAYETGHWYLALWSPLCAINGRSIFSRRLDYRDPAGT